MNIKDAIKLIESKNIYYPTGELSYKGAEAIGELLSFAKSALDCKGWPEKKNYSAIAASVTGSLTRALGYNEAIDLCLAAHAADVAELKNQLSLYSLTPGQVDDMAVENKRLRAMTISGKITLADYLHLCELNNQAEAEIERLIAENERLRKELEATRLCFVKSEIVFPKQDEVKDQIKAGE